MLRAKLVILPSLVNRIPLFESRLTSSLLNAPQSALQTFSYSKDASNENQMPAQTPQQNFLYDAPFSNAVKRVKKLSLFSCGCAIAACPVILGLDATTSATAKASIVSTLAGFGVFTTGLLHWFTSPYIHKLTYIPQENAADVVTLNVLGRPHSQRIQLENIHEADSVHPLSTFAVGTKIYYIDVDNFKNKELLRRLVPHQAIENQQQTLVKDGDGRHNLDNNNKMSAEASSPQNAHVKND